MVLLPGALSEKKREKMTWISMDENGMQSHNSSYDATRTKSELVAKSHRYCLLLF
jgi:hypothetical protein